MNSALVYKLSTRNQLSIFKIIFIAYVGNSNWCGECVPLASCHWHLHSHTANVSPRTLPNDKWLEVFLRRRKDYCKDRWPRGLFFGLSLSYLSFGLRDKPNHFSLSSRKISSIFLKAFLCRKRPPFYKDGKENASYQWNIFFLENILLIKVSDLSKIVYSHHWTILVQ